MPAPATSVTTAEGGKIRYNSPMRRLIGTLVLASFGGIALLSLAFLGASTHDGAGMPGCPLMPAQAVVCTMTALDHIVAWQGMVTAVPQAAFLLLAALAFLVAWPRLVLTLHPSWGEERFASREETPPIPLLQELFSRGILNPKLH